MLYLSGVFMSKKQINKRKNQETPRQENTTIPNHESSENFAAHFEEICDQIDHHVLAASRLVSRLDPLQILQRAFTEYAVLTLGESAESEIPEAGAIARRMIDYVQCLIVSTPPSKDGYEKMTEDLWAELGKHIDEVFSLLLPYFIVATSKRQMEESYDDEWEKLFTRAQMNWCFVKGDRHLNHMYAHFKPLLETHNEVFIKLFGISANQFVDEIEKIKNALTYGLFDSVSEISQLHRRFFDRLEEDPLDNFNAPDIGNFFRDKLKEFDYLERFEEALGKFIGLDLFDLEKVTDLPSGLLDNLAWEPGENVEFLTQEPYKGWPLNLWPTWNRPFLEVEGKYYCFDLYSLSDNLYRAIQKMIYRLEPSYKETWNRNQQAVSEQLPLTLFSNLLPGATILPNIHYRWKTGQTQSLNWSECDGLVIYDDHLFILEVKAGAFTYTPPATDAPAFIESIKSLLLKPVKQGQHFLDYLRSSKSVPIFDESHNQLGTLSNNDFRVTTICCITLDQITELSAKSGHLQAVEGGVKGGNIWTVSIDDLRVYADLLGNPLQFLHFIEQRHKAFDSHEIILDDELDHLGLYLHHNCYARHAQKRFPRSDLAVWVGYTDEIDKYYSSLLSGEEASSPNQEMPEILRQVLTILAAKKSHGRARVASKLLDMSGKARNDFGQMVDEGLSRTQLRKRPQPFSILGEVKITGYCHLSELRFTNSFNIKEHVMANMLLVNESERLLLELYFDSDLRLTNVEYCILTENDIEKYGKENIEKIAGRLAHQRIEKAREIKKIGRNDPCPCGSGRKYKHCHWGM